MARRLNRRQRLLARLLGIRVPAGYRLSARVVAGSVAEALRAGLRLRLT